MKRAQAALEFLMTYGWAILVVLAAISALAYFGVLSPDRFLPEKCTLPSGIACLDFASDGAGITVVLQNSMGLDMQSLVVGLNGTGCVVSNQTSGPSALQNGQKGTFLFTCTPDSGKWRGIVTVTYLNPTTQLSHSKSGELVLAVP